MSTSISYEDISELVEELKEHQIVVGYTIFRALKENKNITSAKDFSDFFSDVKNSYTNLKDFKML